MKRIGDLRRVITPEFSMTGATNCSFAFLTSKICRMFTTTMTCGNCGLVSHRKIKFRTASDEFNLSYHAACFACLCRAVAFSPFLGEAPREVPDEVLAAGSLAGGVAADKPIRRSGRH